MFYTEAASGRTLSERVKSASRKPFGASRLSQIAPWD
jgi:hypothetical protein